MASQMSYTVRGRTFIVTVKDPDNAKIQQLANDLQAKNPGWSKSLCLSTARAKERQERGREAYEKALKAGTLYEVQPCHPSKYRITCHKE